MTYEYLCTACAHAWEAEQPISADPLKTCPACGADTAKRQVSGGAGFILKGGGWYADLYSSAKPGGASKKSESESSSSSSASSTSSTNTSTESKPSSSSDTSSSSSSSNSTSGGTKPTGAAAG
jgi:putative FmdB family regulatory protein